MKPLRPLAALATPRGRRRPCSQAHAQAADWPARPITMIVPYAPGGFADTRVRCWRASWANRWDNPSWSRTRPAPAAWSAPT